MTKKKTGNGNIYHTGTIQQNLLYFSAGMKHRHTCSLWSNFLCSLFPKIQEQALTLHGLGTEPINMIAGPALLRNQSVKLAIWVLFGTLATEH